MLLAVKRIIPAPVYAGLMAAGKRISAWGWARYCPICRSHLRKFETFGSPRRPEARCPICGSLERHRLAWLYFKQRTDLFDGRFKRFLHVAPEPRLSRMLVKIPNIEYVSGDLSAGDALVRLDVTDIAFPAGRFDVVYCSHVLEHVVDDRRAMRELGRVLKPGGWAILQVPIKGDTTIEDPSVVTPAERERVFGQRDHVRIYGRDYADRLAEAGFAVTVDGFARGLPPVKARYFGLDREEDIYVCGKPMQVGSENAPGMGETHTVGSGAAELCTRCP